MIQSTIDNIKVCLYTDANEFTKDFFDIPEGAILDETDLPLSAGFACIEENAIWIYRCEGCTFEDLLSTVAHELGHIITGGYSKNLPESKRYDKKHEQKAEHYEQFVMRAYRITDMLFRL